MHSFDAPDPDSGVAHRYRALLDIGRTLAGTLSSDDLYEAIYKETARVLEASGFFISIYDESADRADVVFFADRGVIKHEVDISYPGVQSQVIRERTPVMVRDRLDERALAEVGDAEADLTRSAISAPMIYKGRLLGAISAQSYEVDAYTEEDLALLRGIADIAGVAVDNAQHVSELSARRREAEEVEEIGRALASSLDAREVLGMVVDAVTTILDVHGAAVWLCDADGSEPCRTARVAASAGEILLPEGLTWHLSEGLAHRVVQRMEPVVVDDISGSELIPDEIREHISGGSGVGLPLVVGDEVAGFLTAGSRAPRSFSESDVEVLRRLAGQASVALKNARLHANLQALSLTDALTGLPNRRHLEIHLQKEVAAARRGRSLVVVVFDLDDFKEYNDTLGHLVGDDILRAFARVLADENRAMNMVARYGGDEFVSVLSESYLDGAKLYARRVTDAIAADPLLEEHGLTVSIGLAEFDRASMKGADDVLQAADADMYRVKAKGQRGVGRNSPFASR